MPRPRRMRRVWFEPSTTYFKPAGIKTSELEEIILTVTEAESIRLKDFLGMDQIKAAKKMNISQPTFNRLLTSARKKIADAIINGKSIRIQGGNFKMMRPKGGRFRAGQEGKGRMGGTKAGAGPAGECVCPKCGYKTSHGIGEPCYSKTCPKCKIKLTRA